MHFRAYIDKKIVKGKGGGEHIRVVDVEAADHTEARALVDGDLKRGEAIGEIVVIKPSAPNSDGGPVA